MHIYLLKEVMWGSQLEKLMQLVAAARLTDKIYKKVAYKNCLPFISCISEISNTQIDNPKEIGVVMSMYGLIEHTDNYSIISASFSLLQRYTL